MRPIAPIAAVEVRSNVPGADSQAAEGEPGAIAKAWLGHEIEYRVRPGRLEIEVAGVWMRPRSRVVSLGPGRYGVALDVGVQVIDQQAHAISTATGRGLALAAERFGLKDGSERFADARGVGLSPAIELAPQQGTELHARWPLPGQPGLERGQRLRIEVGLWGLSRPGEPTKPVRRLFAVDVAEMGPGQPWLARVVPPPTSG